MQAPPTSAISAGQGTVDVLGAVLAPAFESGPAMRESEFAAAAREGGDGGAACERDVGAAAFGGKPGMAACATGPLGRDSSSVAHAATVAKPPNASSPVRLMLGKDTILMVLRRPTGRAANARWRQKIATLPLYCATTS
jgi:hypothetical protein